MRRNQIIFGVVLLLVLASFGAVYQFYFKEKLAQYNKDRQFRKELETSALELSTFFSGTDPEAVISRWRNQVQPWADVLEGRSAYFNDANWYKHETPPEAGRILRVWYGEQLNKMLTDLYAKVQEKAPNIYPFPEDILQTIEVKTEAQLGAEREEVTPGLINSQLAKLAFATKLIDRLLDEKVVGITDIKIWPKRQDKKHNAQLLLQTVGLEIDIYMRHLVHFLDSLTQENRYFNVDAIHLSNAFISNPQEPVMHVKLILTQATYAGKLDSAAPNTTGGSAKDLYGMTTTQNNIKRPPPPPPELTGFGKAWKWFKRNILYMSG